MLIGLARRAALRPWPEYRRLVVATVSLLMARLSLRLPLKRLIGPLHLASGQTPADADPIVLAEAEPIGRAVHVAAGRLPGTSACLAQATTVSALLSRGGIASTLDLGVATDGSAARGMEAHAWSRCGTALLAGGEIHERFAPVASYASHPRPHDG